MYLGGILVYNQSYEGHVKHMREVLEVLREREILVNPKRILYCQEEFVYLSHVISTNGIHLDLKKDKSHCGMAKTKDGDGD